VPAWHAHCNAVGHYGVARAREPIVSALQAVLKFVQVLRGLPPGVIAAERIFLQRPARAAELPTIAVSMTAASESPVGIGHHVDLSEIAPDEWATTTGTRAKGELHAEVWAASATEALTLMSAILQRLDDQAAAMRALGFLGLSIKTLGPAQPLPAGTDAALMMPLVFETTFENLVTPPPGGEGVIKTVHVDITGDLDENDLAVELEEAMDIQKPD
jgi:hypothetical protein